jgi:redox-sensitive bicupin YhaK (pirin superfamily)
MTAVFNVPVTRTLARVIASVPASDGAGVRLRRSIGAQPSHRLDPFLMLDEFSSEDAADYLAGFPSHPHRGFETVTYMLDGHLLHEDHLGNRGDLLPGAVQWMTAGRGIIHSEMPQQQSGRMRGFQLWLNLPARLKMQPAWYRDIAPADVPVVALPGGGQLKVIAGTARMPEAAGALATGAVMPGGSRAACTTHSGEPDSTLIRGPIGGPRWQDSTDPIYWDLILEPHGCLVQPLPAGHQAFVYLYEGQAWIGPADDRSALPAHAAGVLSEGTQLRIEAGGQGLRALVLAARPLKEPVAQYGPFVMNTREELEQAVADFRSGRLT